MSLEMSLIELYNPLYMFPIIGVVFCALLVYAFGFKSETLPPNFYDLDDDKKDKSIKKKKSNKDSVKGTTGKSQNQSVIQPNGNINVVKVLEKKTVQKKAPVIETKSSSVSNDKVVNSNKVNAKKDKIKNRKNNALNVSTQEEGIEDADSGEWVQLISKKERKNRKQKQENISNQLKETTLGFNNRITLKTSPKKQTKKGKENKDKTVEKSVGLDSNANIDKTIITTDNKQKENSVNAENDANYAKQENVVKEEDLIAEDPDIYEMVKEQRERPSKKLQKHRNNKRNSESEITPKLESIVENETNVSQTDKLTASIVANYEATDQNKPDSLSTANNKKKKDKNKKKQSQTPNNATNDKQLKDNNKIALTPVNDTPVEKSGNALNIPNNEVKPSEDDDFKVLVSKKRRARRE